MDSHNALAARLLDHSLKNLGADAIASYENKYGPITEAQREAVAFGAGFAFARTASAFSQEVISPLEKRVRRLVIGSVVALVLSLATAAGAAFAVYHPEFIKWLWLGVPSVLSSAYVAVKTLKAVADTRKTLAEAKKIEAELNK
ncbi:hypothetical protein [Xanthomonas axonopodis]|uniref:hypothetical protein n=1 Tax=Xanthomonas axonopodis TaxID=53413 RepID=UPI001115EF6F|nr:hypothetical protein [Xanthomonas axonopodis]